VKEHFLALGSADKPEPTVTDDSLDSPLHGHLGERMGIFALVQITAWRPAREATTRIIGATLPPPERVVKGETATQPISTGEEETRGQEVRSEGKSIFM
jgi:hypothetical protein